MAKKIEFGKSGLGDISNVLHNVGLSDLSWLDVDPDDYHKAEALPKQNLDVIPELQRALTFNDGNVPSLIPLRPHTMVNTNPLDPPGTPARNMAKEIVNRVAGYLISGLSTRQIGEKLRLEFSPSQIRDASSGIETILTERGLIGNVYIDAHHFPRCAQDSDDKRFVASRAKSAKFVLTKQECTGCVHNRGGMCSNLHKRLVEHVPYDRQNFAHYAVQLASQGRVDKQGLGAAVHGSDEDRKRFLKNGFCSSPVNFKRDYMSGLTLRHQDQEVKPAVTEQQMAAVLAKPAQQVPTLSRAFIAASKHIMLGGSPDAIAGSSDPEVRKIASMYGILGHTYIDMDAFGGCSKTLSLISKMDAAPDFVVRRSACCTECKDASDGSCAKIRSVTPIVEEAKIEREHLVTALLRASDRGAISIEAARHAASKAPSKSNWQALVSQANLLKPAQQQVSYGGARVTAHHGVTIPEWETISTPSVDAEEIRKSISHMMNSGMSGKALRNSILSRYSRSDLVKVPKVGAELAKNDGIQGLYFVDPTAYPDYGRGCSAGAKHFRKIGAPNVMAGEACTGCSMQTAPGWCAKYSKNLIRQIPGDVITAAAEARKHNSIQIDTPVENPVEKYQLSASIVVEPDKRLSLPEICFENHSVTE
jgi:hypothetical protein